MQRILRRRSGSPQHADEQPTGAQQQPTGQLRAGLPTGEAAPPPSPPSFHERGRLRRRLRYLRRARELGFRDLGGLIFDLQRFGRDRPDLVQAKLDALAGVDRELRDLETALDERRPIHELREPGIAGCPRCGALHGTDARFCPACGTALRTSKASGGPSRDAATGSRGTARADGEKTDPLGAPGAGETRPDEGEAGLTAIDAESERRSDTWP